MQKKPYERPEMEVATLSAEAVLLSSDAFGGVEDDETLFT